MRRFCAFIKNKTERKKKRASRCERWWENEIQAITFAASVQRSAFITVEIAKRTEKKTSHIHFAHDCWICVGGGVPKQWTDGKYNYILVDFSEKRQPLMLAAVFSLFPSVRFMCDVPPSTITPSAMEKQWNEKKIDEENWNDWMRRWLNYEKQEQRHRHFSSLTNNNIFYK